jgi:DNA polymerase I|tara:strand:+ start:1462 stop:3234 length:1773 start_codon:yes stop_codon:yes gene_type:complete
MSNLVFDIEANGLEPDKVFCIVALDVDTKKVHMFDNTQLEQGYALLKSADKLIGHNILGYDLPVIKRLGGLDLFDKKIVDTLVLSRLFKPTREGNHGLEGWGYRLGFVKGDYGNAEDAWEHYTPEMLEYCTNDVLLNYKVYVALRQESKGFTAQSVQIEHAVAKIVNEQRNTGFLLDVKKVMGLMAMFETKLHDLEEEVHEEFRPVVTTQILKPKFTATGAVAKTATDQHGKGTRLTDEEYEKLSSDMDCKPIARKTETPFNLGSRKQIGEYLIRFGWNPKKHTPTGQPIVDESTLNKVRNIPQAALIAKYLMVQKRLAQTKSWIKELNDDTGRVHGYVNPNGAVTSRMTHSHPNMAQIPSSTSPYGEECRSCWTVPDSYRLVGIDASGLELRMLAHYLNDEGYTNAIVNGDIHTTNQNLAGLESRNKAKTFIYALLYGAGDVKLGSVANRGRAGGKELRQRFFDNLPSFKDLTGRVQREAKSGFIKALDGRKLTVRSEHAALNTLLQGAGSIVMKQALIILDQKIKNHGWDAKFVANVHDEWQIECHVFDAVDVGKAGVQAIKEAGCMLNLNCPLDGDYKVGDNWSETH